MSGRGVVHHAGELHRNQCGAGPAAGERTSKRWAAVTCDACREAERVRLTEPAPLVAAGSAVEVVAAAAEPPAPPTYAELVLALQELRDAAADAYRVGRVDALAFVHAGNVLGRVAAPLVAAELAAAPEVDEASGRARCAFCARSVPTVAELIGPGRRLQVHSVRPGRPEPCAGSNARAVRREVIA